MTAVFSLPMAVLGQNTPDFKETCCDVPGDANNNGSSASILDITYLIAYLYFGGPTPPCMYEADPNGDCAINILDIIYCIDYLYNNGPQPICAEECPGW
jgi:hypothetical protein